jgi:hypothetical protein
MKHYCTKTIIHCHHDFYASKKQNKPCFYFINNMKLKFVLQKQEDQFEVRKTKSQRDAAQGPASPGQVKCQNMCFVLLIKPNR